VQIDSPVLITLPDWSWCSFIADKTPHPIHVWNLNPMRKFKTFTDKATIENRHHTTQNYPLFLLLVHDIQKLYSNPFTALKELAKDKYIIGSSFHAACTFK
jgi:hypothetical protein